MGYNPSDFAVGDRVRFRVWYDMATEYGALGGTIGCECEFVPEMEHLCGTTATIRKIVQRNVDLTDFETDGNTDFFFSTDMIEPANSVIPCEFDEDQFLSIIG